MKKYIYILVLIFLSSHVQAHTSDYKGLVKIELEIFRNNEAIGYSNYFFEHEENTMIVKNYTQNVLHLPNQYKNKKHNHRQFVYYLIRLRQKK